MKSESEVAQSCLTLSDPMDYSLPGSSVHGIFQARVLEWSAIAFSKSRKLSEPHTIGIFMEPSSYRHDQLLTPFPAPFSVSGEWGRWRFQQVTEAHGGGVENSKLLIMAGSLW